MPSGCVLEYHNSKHPLVLSARGMLHHEGFFGSGNCAFGRRKCERSTAEFVHFEHLLQSVDAFHGYLQKCVDRKDLVDGRRLHVFMVSNGLDLLELLGNQLVRFYGACGSLPEANLLYHKVGKPSVYTWQAIISTHAMLGQNEEAVDLYHTMWQHCVLPSKFVLSSALKACGSLKSLEDGRQLHDHAIKFGFHVEVVLGTALIDMYAKCGSMEEAHKVFDNLSDRNILSWGAMITGYAQQDLGFLALELFQKMQEEGLEPDEVIFAGALKACGIAGIVSQGRLIHELFVKSGIKSDVVIGNTIVDMYAKFGSLEEAHKIFIGLPSKNIVSCGAMIAGYAQAGQGSLALGVFENMQLEDILPNEVVYMSALKACGSIGALIKGRLMHEQIILYGFDSDMAVGSTLIDMYVKCGNLEDAHKVLDTSSNRDVVSWGALIFGYAQDGHGLSVLHLFQRMQEEGLKPDGVIILCTLKACSNLGAIDQGMLIHKEIMNNGFELDLVIGNTLVDMYAKCGSLEDSERALEGLPDRDIVSWNAMISGYAQHGENSELVSQFLREMHQQGITPDDKTYSSILVACSHMGILEEGPQYFKSMLQNHGITPSIELYSCMLDLLGRAGRLVEAVDLLYTLPVLPDVVVWKSLLTSCKTYNNMDLGRWCFDEVVHMNAADAFGYILMSNLYADFDMWKDASKLKDLRSAATAEKKPGMAWIEVQNEVHEFVVGKFSHPMINTICSKLRRIQRGAKDDNHMPHLDLILEPMLAEV